MLEATLVDCVSPVPPNQITHMLWFGITFHVSKVNSPSGFSHNAQIFEKIKYKGIESRSAAAVRRSNNHMRCPVPQRTRERTCAVTDVAIDCAEVGVGGNVMQRIDDGPLPTRF